MAGHVPPSTHSVHTLFSVPMQVEEMLVFAFDMLHIGEPCWQLIEIEPSSTDQMSSAQGRHSVRLARPFSAAVGGTNSPGSRGWIRMCKRATRVPASKRGVSKQRG